ncbi:ead/Ea22-like family protein [Enterobacter hormaechei]|nr:ead/Ea22-like family protein [Enterobacter hormaechei]
MSNIEKQALRKRYSAKPTPKCDICGARMTMQRMSGSRVTYGCSGAIYDETGCHYAEGRSLADDHYEQSRVTVTDESDPDVLALLDELEAAERRSTELTEALRQSVIGYKSCLRMGYDRILDLGGDCDSPEVMIAGNPDIQQAEKLLAAAAGKGE